MMKKLCISISLSLFSTLFALPIGNLYEATHSTRGIGFYGDYISNRYMGIDTPKSNLQVTKTTLNTNAAYLSYNPHKRINLFVTPGVSNINLKNELQITIKSKSAFSYSTGLRAIALQTKGVALGVEASYFLTNPSINSSTDPRMIDIDYIDDEKMHYTDWQFALTSSTRIPFSPTTNLFAYMGVKYNRAKLDMGNKTLPLTAGDLRLSNLENIRSYGISVGLTLAGTDIWSLTAEERLIDEKAFCITGQLHF